MGLPQITAVGTIKKTNLTYIPSGKALFKFTVECSEKSTNGEWDNLYLNGELWGKQAEFGNQYFKDGSVAIVTGKLVTKMYEKQDGTKVYENKLLFPSLSFVPKDKGQNQGQAQRNMQEPPTGGGEYINNKGLRDNTIPEIDLEDSDSIPF